MQTHHFAATVRDPGDPVPLVSVVIPNHNGAATIERCLEAVLASRYPRFEVIVADDGSQDDSLERMARFACRVVRLPSRAGAGAARNAGARASRGAVLFFTDADCLLHPDALARAVAALGEAPEVAVGGTYTLEPSRPDFLDRFQSVFVHHLETRRAPAADYLATHALALRASTFHRHAGFRENADRILEDVEFSHRLRRAGCRLVMRPDILAQHVFDFSLARSLRNGFNKARHWTHYSLDAGDLLADSGTASRGLKFDVLAWSAGTALVAAGLIWPAPAALACAGALQLLNVYANRDLLRAFLRAHGPRFALAAAAYYLLVYPVAVGAGGLAGAIAHGAQRRARSA